MSEVATAVTAQGGKDGPPPLPSAHRLLNRVRWFGYGLLCLELAGYLVWSVYQYHRFSLTGDYAQYAQAWFLVAHGNLDFPSINGFQHFWQQDAEFIPYILAPLYWVVHSGQLLQWAQDLSVVGAEMVAFTWLCDLARRRCAERDAAWLAGLGLLLLAANPWIWWTVAFDVHEEALVMVFAVLMAWDLSRGKRRALAWAVPVMLGGVPTTTYVLGLGLGGILAGRRSRTLGVALVVASLAYTVFLTAVHGNGANSFITGYLQITVHHPLQPVETLWDLRADMFANLAPSGLLGIGAPLFLPLAAAVLIPNTLTGLQFGEPIFQSLPVYVLIPVGTVVVLAWLLRRRRRATLVLAGLIAAQAIGWAAVWAPRTPSQWVRVSSAAAATLASVQARIPENAEVIASQGIVGPFATRGQVYAILQPGRKTPLSPDTWFVITPTQGIETLTAISMALIGEVAGPLHGQLVTHANGVWAFRVNPPPGIHSITIPGGTSPLPAWAASGAAGLPVIDGPEPAWHMAATGASGYVSDGIQWQVDPGKYRVNATLSASAPVNVELWDDTTNELVARQTIPQTDGAQQVDLPFTVPAVPAAGAFPGWGPFRADFVPPPPGQRLEVRVWSPGGVAVNVYTADLTTATGTAVPLPS